MACNKAPHTESGRDFQWVEHPEHPVDAEDPEELEAPHSKRSRSTPLQSGRLPDWQLTDTTSITPDWEPEPLLSWGGSAWAAALLVEEKRQDEMFWHFSHYPVVDSNFLHDVMSETWRASAEYIWNKSFISVPLSNNAPFRRPKTRSLPNFLTLQSIPWFPGAPNHLWQTAWRRKVRMPRHPHI